MEKPGTGSANPGLNLVAGESRGIRKAFVVISTLDCVSSPTDCTKSVATVGAGGWNYEPLKK
jgi:hypothetical protein